MAGVMPSMANFMRTTLTAILWGVLLTGCGEMPAEDQDVYGALFTHLEVKSSDIVVIREESITSDDEFFRDAIKIETNRALDWPFENLLERNKQAKGLRSIIGQKPGVSFVTERDLMDAFSLEKRKSLDDAWKAFFQQHPGANGYLSLSLPGLSRDHKRAIVYVTFHCGPLCGQGDVFFLKKESGQWKVEMSSNIWVS